MVSTTFAGELSGRFYMGAEDVKGERTPGKNLEMAYRFKDTFFSPKLVVGAFNTGNIQTTNYNLHMGFDWSMRLVTRSGIYADIAQGVSFIQDTTPRLSEKLQWPTTLEVGLSDGKHSLGLVWKHFSSGKATAGNRGHDYVGFNVSVRLGQ